jgi:AcrR family transcriptional regulator
LGKSEKTIELIFKTAASLFSQKGYSAVTMKDICDGSGLSRGGLYRYFGSTKEIFTAILNRDVTEGKEAVEVAIAANTPAMRIFNHFLEYEKDAILGEQNGIYFAVHEFAFCEPDTRDMLSKRLEATLSIIGAIVNYGQQRGEFKSFDTEVIASHIVYFLDALKTSSIIFSITEDFVDKQFEILRGMLK